MDPWRLFYVVGGLLLAFGSLAFGVLPGPGMLTFFVGVGMIAGEFRPVARLLDSSEVRARELGRWVGGMWRSSAAGKVMVAFVGAIGFGVVLGRLTSCSSVADLALYSPKCVERLFSKVRVYVVLPAFLIGQPDHPEVDSPVAELPPVAHGRYP
jgi:hypothetical protein